MSNTNNDETDPRIEQVLRLGNLRKEVMDRIDGPVLESGIGNLPMDMQEKFWNHVLAFESAEDSTYRERLKNEADFIPIDPKALKNDAEIHTALWDLIRALASIRIFVSDTDHLSDSELYRLLCYEVLESPTSVPPAGSEWNTCIMACEYGTDEETREAWEDTVPPKEIPPYDRDRFLPNAQNEDGELENID